MFFLTMQIINLSNLISKKNVTDYIDMICWERKNTSSMVL